MPDSPPLTPPQQNESHDSETQQHPNISVTDSEDPSQKSQLLTPPSENPIDDPIQPEIVPDDDDEPGPEQEPEESEDLNVTHSNSTTMVSEVKGTNNTRNRGKGRGGKRKKGGKNQVNQATLERKTQRLLQGFNPIPFIPGKNLDFEKYEEFLRKLGLWDFAHIEFDKSFRVDLIGELIMSYSVKQRGSYVKGFKIGVNRADLARALKLPTSKKADCDVEEFEVEFLGFLEEFVSNLLLLHGDLWMTPNEVLAAVKGIKDGCPQKIDWAGLIWYMVEKELGQKEGLKDCYYAAHLQRLLKFQKEDLFLDVGVEEREKEVEAVEVGDDDEEDGDEVKMMAVEVEEEETGNGGQKLEGQNVELRLGQDCDAMVEKDGDEVCADDMEKLDNFAEQTRGVDVGNSEDKVENVEDSEHIGNVVEAGIAREEIKDDVEMMDFGGNYKEEEEEQGQGQWFLDGKFGGQHFLRPCSAVEMKVGGDGGLEGVGDDHEVEVDGHVEGFKILSKSHLDGMTSANLMQAFETGQLPYSSTELGGQSSLDLMSSRADDSMMLGGQHIFNQAGKQEIDHGHNISHHGLSDSHKRMRVENSWDDKPSEVVLCLDQIMQWTEKAKIRAMSDAEETFQQASLTQHMFTQQMAEKDSEILQLRYKLEDVQRVKQGELDRLNRELYLMNSVVDGYRKALKQTQKAFADYRKRCQVPDEPVYKDAGLGGVVKSVAELERERLKQEEENKMMRKYIEETFRENLNECEVKWESEVLEKVQSHHSRLMDAVKEVEVLKDLSMKCKASVDVQNEPEDHSE